MYIVHTFIFTSQFSNFAIKINYTSPTEPVQNFPVNDLTTKYHATTNKPSQPEWHTTSLHEMNSSMKKKPKWKVCETRKVGRASEQWMMSMIPSETTILASKATILTFTFTYFFSSCAFRKKSSVLKYVFQ